MLIPIGSGFGSLRWRCTLASNIGRKKRAEPIPPEANGFVANVYPPVQATGPQRCARKMEISHISSPRGGSPRVMNEGTETGKGCRSCSQASGDGKGAPILSTPPQLVRRNPHLYARFVM